MALLTSLPQEKATLNNALNRVYDTLRSVQFNTYLKNSGLKKMDKVSKGYPNGNPDGQEIYVNTSANEDCIDVDWVTGLTELNIVIDVFIKNEYSAYIWKYMDAVRQWLQQFKIGVATLGFTGRIYSMQSGATANHFAINFDVIADISNDFTDPLEA